MAETKTITEKLIWGTWEELLLVSAVKRHGTKNWDSVAMEIQNRLSSQSSQLVLTPQNCKHKYHDLRRRFISNINDSIEEVEDDDDDSDSMNPWVEELRKLRVAELRKELQQYDVSIVSLQLKVQKLTEERQRSSDEFEKPADLEDKGNFAGVEMEKPVSGDDSENENQSFNESNSTDPKERSLDNEPDESHKKTQPNEATNNSGRVSGDFAGDTDPVTSVSPVPVAGGEGSYNGSSETIAKDSVNPTLKLLSDLPSLKNEPGESPELWESVAESKGEGKESSDVQSSASLSKENRCRKKEVSVSSSGEEPETDEISPAINGRDGKSHPFVKVLEMIKSHKYGYVFERRLDSQETSKYKSIIRQHMDLETVSKRLKAGKYSGSRSKFFRDLLLLINNAIVFFPNNSSEFAAAIELRQLVSKEMGSRTRKTSKSSETLPPPTTTAPPLSLPKSDPEHPNSLLAKPKTMLPIISCRKRSSIMKGNKASEKKETVGGEEKKSTLLDRKQQDNGVASLLDDKLVIKKGKRDRPGSGPRSSRTGKAPTNMNSSKPSPIDEDNNNAEKTEKEKEKQSNVNTVAKKRSVANFLNRMKTPPPSSSSNSTLLDSLKNTGITPSNGKANNTDQKKGSGGRGSGTKQSLTKKNSNSPAKRSVGRPPKRNASSPVTPPPPPKRSRDTNETEAAASKQPRKRAKR